MGWSSSMFLQNLSFIKFYCSNYVSTLGLCDNDVTLGLCQTMMWLWDYVTSWLTDWLTAWLTHSLTHWLTVSDWLDWLDWLPGYQATRLASQPNSAYSNWKETNLHLTVATLELACLAPYKMKMIKQRRSVQWRFFTGPPEISFPDPWPAEVSVSYHAFETPEIQVFLGHWNPLLLLLLLFLLFFSSSSSSSASSSSSCFSPASPPHHLPPPSCFNQGIQLIKMLKPAFSNFCWDFMSSCHSKSKLTSRPRNQDFPRVGRRGCVNIPHD